MNLSLICEKILCTGLSACCSGSGGDRVVVGEEEVIVRRFSFFMS